jgi:hypothetical protein
MAVSTQIFSLYFAMATEGASDDLYGMPDLNILGRRQPDYIGIVRSHNSLQDSNLTPLTPEERLRAIEHTPI